MYRKFFATAAFIIGLTQAIKLGDAVDDVNKMQKDLKAPVEATAGQSHVIDALTDNTTCEEALNYTQTGLDEQMEYWSRNLSLEYYENAKKIWKNLTDNVPGYKGVLDTHTFELYDKAFEFSRVRRYQDVQENMDMLEHFEDNLNMNPMNSKALANFLRVATTVRKNFQNKYAGDGGFVDPANTDPFDEKKPEFKDFSSDNVF